MNHATVLSHDNPHGHSVDDATQARWYALIAMTMANALHFGAYELARSAIVALWTSSSWTLASTTTTPLSTTTTISTTSTTPSSTLIMTLAMGGVSPISILVLTIHRRIFDRCGPQLSLRYTTLIYAILFSSAAVVVRYCAMPIMTHHDHHQHRYLAQSTIVILFILKNCLVQLLASQHWSFITGTVTTTTIIIPTTTSTTGSITTTTPKTIMTTTLPTLDSDRWTTMIAGVGSIVATLCGWMVAPFLQYVCGHHHDDDDNDYYSNSHHKNDCHGLTALLICAACMLILATICSDEAYRMAHKVRQTMMVVRGHTPCMLLCHCHIKHVYKLNQKMHCYDRYDFCPFFSLSVSLCLSLSV